MRDGSRAALRVAGRAAPLVLLPELVAASQPFGGGDAMGLQWVLTIGIPLLIVVVMLWSGAAAAFAWSLLPILLVAAYFASDWFFQRDVAEQHINALLREAYGDSQYLRTAAGIACSETGRPAADPALPARRDVRPSSDWYELPASLMFRRTGEVSAELVLTLGNTASNAEGDKVMASVLGRQFRMQADCTKDGLRWSNDWILVTEANA